MQLLKWFAEEYDPKITLTQVCEVSCMHMSCKLAYEQGNMATEIFAQEVCMGICQTQYIN